MNDTLPTGEMRGFDSRGKFAKGNSLARGNPLNRLAQSMRARAIRCAAKGGDVDRVFEQLFADATDAGAPVIARVAAAKVYLGYVLGRPEQTLNVNQSGTGTKPNYSLDQMVVALETLGVPDDRWPPLLREHRRKQISGTVTDKGQAP
jgi:hypothetical protein